MEKYYIAYLPDFKTSKISPVYVLKQEDIDMDNSTVYINGKEVYYATENSNFYDDCQPGDLVFDTGSNYTFYRPGIGEVANCDSTYNDSVLGTAKEILKFKKEYNNELYENKNMKKNIKLNESQLRNMIAKSIKSILKEGDYDDIDFSKTDGVRLPSGDDWYYSPKDTKKAILGLQQALRRVMDMCNGNRLGDELSDELWQECYNFYSFISKYCIELDDECSDINGKWTKNMSNVPFIRKYGENSSIPRYFDKSGKAINDKERFGSNFTPHNR